MCAVFVFMLNKALSISMSMSRWRPHTQEHPRHRHLDQPKHCCCRTPVDSKRERIYVDTTDIHTMKCQEFRAITWKAFELSILLAYILLFMRNNLFDLRGLTGQFLKSFIIIIKWYRPNYRYHYHNHYHSYDISCNVFKPLTHSYSIFCSYKNENDEQKNNKQTQTKKLNIKNNEIKNRTHTCMCIYIQPQ